jgi:hypothetical protein
MTRPLVLALLPACAVSCSIPPDESADLAVPAKRPDPRMPPPDRSVADLGGPDLVPPEGSDGGLEPPFKVRCHTNDEGQATRKS